MSTKAPRKKTARKPAHPVVLGYDLGGTKVAVGVVDSRGKILEEMRVPAQFEKGKNAVMKQLGDLGAELIGHYPKIKRVGIASAGPLDAGKGLLLDPTNFKSAEGPWGIVPIAKILSKRLKRPVSLENDAAAAMLAEHWIGAARGYDNAMILTLGTGLGTGIIANGVLVRGGRGLHPEAGHVILRAEDASAPCGCGNLGCAEAFLSGRSFSRRARTRFGSPNLSAQDIAELARKGDPRAVAAFDEYAGLMAVAIQNYIRLYYPEIIVFTGSFAQASDLFLDKTRERLKHLLRWDRGANGAASMMPELDISHLDNNAGVIGGAYVALH
jgi:glucokinase